MKKTQGREGDQTTRSIGSLSTVPAHVIYDIVRKLPNALWQIDPDLAALRADARFAAVLKRAFPDAQGEGKQEQKGAR